MKHEQIVEKIKKLLALANSSNENEAQTAAKMAQQLLTKYNLTMSQVDKAELMFEVDSETENRQRTSSSWGYTQSILRKFFFVEIVSSRSQGFDLKAMKRRSVITHHFIGKRHNIEIAKYVKEFLERTFSNLFEDYRKRTGAPLKSRKSFYAGVYKGLHDQLKGVKEYVEQETGLVVVEDAEVQKFINETLGKTKEVANKNDIQDFSAYRTGTEEGKKVRLSRALGGPEEKKKISETLKIEGK